MNPYNLYTKGFALKHTGSIPDAIATFQEILRNHPNDEEALANLAEIEVSQANYQSAIPLYKQLLSLSPDKVSYKEQLNLCTRRLR